MCGICGYIGNFDGDLHHRMNNLMIHRGPDGAGAWQDPSHPIGLAMRRLAIIDVDHGNQPIMNETGDVVVVFNGEIYNHAVLRTELIGHGHRFASHSDTEVLVHGWEEWGEDLPIHLRGMFAFSLWDARRNVLFCARDRLGIKPFYYTQSAGGLAWASEQKPLLLASAKGPALVRRALIRHLLIGFQPGPWSMFQGIQQLPPGTWMRWRDGTLTTQAYWRLEEGARPEGGDPAEAVLAGLGDAVLTHMTSDVPVGLTLSGGLDSSLLATIMGNTLPPAPPPHAYAIGWGHESDEIPFAELAAARAGLPLHTRRLDPVEALDQLPAILWHLEEPLSNVTSLISWGWAGFQAEHLKVTLVGEGADELFAGYPQYRLFSGAGRILPSALRSRMYSHAFLQPSPGLVTALLGGGHDVREEVASVYHDEFARPLSRGRGLKTILGFDLSWELSNNQLMRVDRTSMAHSLEARVPYLDHGLVELAWALPDRLKIHGRNQKAVLRRAAEGSVPDAVLKRPKIGRNGSQGLFPILAAAGLMDMARLALRGRSRALELFDGRVIADLLDGRSGIYPILGSRVRDKLLLALLFYVLWYEQFFERGLGHDTIAPTLREAVG